MDQSGTPLHEMYQVFNMGHRMELYIPSELADPIISIAKGFGVDAQVIGHCEPHSEKKLTIRINGSSLEY
jgi:phosphoribosylformylglycinamidine cyclo-ligase